MTRFPLTIAALTTDLIFAQPQSKVLLRSPSWRSLTVRVDPDAALSVAPYSLNGQFESPIRVAVLRLLRMSP